MAKKTRRRRTVGAAKKRRASGAGCKIERWKGMGRVRACRKKNGALKSWTKVKTRR